MFKRILLALDLTGDTGRAFKVAVRLARSCEAELVLCHVFQPLLGLAMAPRASRLRMEVRDSRLEAVTRQLRTLERSVRRSRLKVSSQLVHGAPSEGVVHLARQAEVDLVVVGTHARKGVSRLLGGSVAEAILRRARCPVLVVPNDSRPRGRK